MSRIKVEASVSLSHYMSYFLLLHCSLLSALSSCGGEVTMTDALVQFHFLDLTWK